MRMTAISMFLLSATLVAGCGKDNAAEEHVAAASCDSDGVSVIDAWVRAAPAGRPMSAAYLTLCNGGETQDAMVAARFAGAADVELHTTTVGEDGVAAMAPIAELPIPAGGQASLAPGGAHIMLIGLSAPLEAGQTVDLTLEFKNAPAQTVSFTVRDAAPGGQH